MMAMIVALRRTARSLGTRLAHATAPCRAMGSALRPLCPSFSAYRGSASHRDSISLRTHMPAVPILGAWRATAGRGVFSEAFYPREQEIAALERMLSSSPSDVLVLSGPPDSGKTTLLREVVSRRAAAHPSEEHPSVLHLDLRPAGVLFPGAPSATAARDAASLYLKFLKERDPTQCKPVIIIDAANVLVRWVEENMSLPQLRLFMDFAITITKQEQLAHVILKTCDFSLASWLGTVGLGWNHYSQHVVGNLPEHDAKRFLCGGDGWPGLVTQFSGVPPVNDHTWAKVYAVCGGNFGLLRRCCKETSTWGSWDGGLRSVIQAPAAAVRRGLRPESMWPGGRASPPAWTADQYKAVLRAIVHSKHHAVLFSTLESSVGDAALDSMVGYNLITRRPYSPLARDLPLEVFGERASGFVATMRSPAALYCAKEMEADGELE